MSIPQEYTDELTRLEDETIDYWPRDNWLLNKSQIGVNREITKDKKRERVKEHDWFWVIELIEWARERTREGERKRIV